MAQRHTRDGARATVVTELGLLGSAAFRSALARLKAGLLAAVAELRQQYWLVFAAIVEAYSDRFEAPVQTALNKAALDEIATGSAFVGPAAYLAALARHMRAPTGIYDEVIPTILTLTSARNPGAVQNAAAGSLCAVLGACAEPALMDGVPTLFDSTVEALMCCAVNSTARAHLFSALVFVARAPSSREHSTKFVRYILLALRDFLQPGRSASDVSCAAERAAVADSIASWAPVSRMEADVELWAACLTCLGTLAKYDKSDVVRRACASAASILHTVMPVATIASVPPSRPVVKSSHAPQEVVVHSDTDDEAVHDHDVALPSHAASNQVASAVEVETSTMGAPAPSMAPASASFDESAFVLEAVIATHQTYRVGWHRGVGHHLQSVLRIVPASHFTKLRPSTLPKMLMQLLVSLLLTTVPCLAEHNTDWSLALPWLTVALQVPSVLSVLGPLAASVQAGLSGALAASDDTESLQARVCAWATAAMAPSTTA